MAWDDLGTPFVSTRVGLAPETVTYTPNAGNERNIQAAVERFTPEDLAGTQRARVKVFRVWVRNHATLGISDQELDTGLDTVAIAGKPGDAQRTTYRNMRIVRENEGGAYDAAMICLEVK